MSGLKRYRILFLGLVDDLERFKERMSELGVNAETAEQMIRKAPVLLKAGITLDHAQRYAEAVRKAGGNVNIQEEAARPLHIKPLEYFTMCTECGHKQPRGECCVRCGRPLSAAVEPNGRRHRS